MDIYKLINNNYVLVDYIKSDDEIDKETLQKIRQRYSEIEEIKLHRQKLNGENINEYNEYNAYVELCRAEGKSKKLINAEKLALTEEIEIGTDIIQKIRVIK